MHTFKVWIRVYGLTSRRFYAENIIDIENEKGYVTDTEVHNNVQDLYPQINELVSVVWRVRQSEQKPLFK